ncbi:MAG: hypothetical protein IJ710_02950 [Prevotella sp.]|nr:hypothetical protein [Prevotella sp.]
MKNYLLSMAFGATLLMASAPAQAQYTTAAPAGGFDINTGTDYIVFYAPKDIVNQMGSKVLSNQQLDADGIVSTCDYWGDDNGPGLSVCNADAGLKNSWGGDDCFNITPTGLWGGVGYACFRSITTKFDLSMLTDDHILHIGFCDNGNVTSGDQFHIIFADGKVKLFLGSASRVTGYTKVGSVNYDKKWYYIEIPVSTLKSLFGASGFGAKQMTDNNFFQFGFEKGTASSVSTVLEPGNKYYTYTVSSLKSAAGIDAFFFYKKDTSGINGTVSDTADDEVQAVYDLTGRRTEMNRPGVYIVKTAKGVKKVTLK